MGHMFIPPHTTSHHQASDGVCDDGQDLTVRLLPGETRFNNDSDRTSAHVLCDLGTDCSDCGTWYGIGAHACLEGGGSGDHTWCGKGVAVGGQVGASSDITCLVGGSGNSGDGNQPGDHLAGTSYFTPPQKCAPLIW